MERSGYPMKVVDTNDLAAVKVRYNIPTALQSCHTAIVNGYIIEGHVPVDSIERLLKEQPAIAGLAVPGMPIGSPGMETPGWENEPYDVLAFDAEGNTSVYASYNR